jgi:ubiquinone/menaquinone biosynthesis C-methylase UbiE
LKTHGRQSDLSFHLMSIEYRLRDWLRSPVAILKDAGLRPGMNVLDLGCGPGGFSVAAARLVGQTARVYAVDISPIALRSVLKAAARAGIGNLRTVLGPALVDVQPGSVDIALLYDVLHDLPEPDTALEDVHRLLKREGLLSVRDHRLGEACLLSAVTSRGLFALTATKKWTFQFTRLGV